MLFITDILVLQGVPEYCRQKIQNGFSLKWWSLGAFLKIQILDIYVNCKWQQIFVGEATRIIENDYFRIIVSKKFKFTQLSLSYVWLL